MKVNNTNEELFDGLFKQDLGNASSPVPSGAWEGISSSISSGAAAGAAVKTAIWMKAAMGLVLVAGISAAIYQYYVSSPIKAEIQNQASKVLNETPSEQEIDVNMGSDLNTKNQKDQKNFGSTKTIDPVMLDEYPDQVPTHFDDFDAELPPPIQDYAAKGIQETRDSKAETSNDESNANSAEEPQPIFLTDQSIKDTTYIEVPDVFTNDGDGINDAYQIKLIGEERVEIIIYTADNQIIFRTKNKYNAWDSRLPNGELAPEGFYFVKVIYKYKNQTESTPIIRRITLIR